MQRALTQEEQMEQANQQSFIATEQAKAVAHGIDLFNLAGIFLAKGMTLLEPIFETTLKYLMLPLVPFVLAAVTGITWYQAYKKRFEAYPVFKAVIETLGFLAITTAVIGALAAPLYFGLAGPIIFAATFGTKTVINIVTAIYNGVMTAITNDPVKKAEYREKAIESAKISAVGVIATAAITAVMIFKFPILAVMGVVAGVFGGVLAVVKYNELSHQKSALASPAVAAVPAENTRTNNAELRQALGIRSDGYTALPTEEEPRAEAVFKAASSKPNLFNRAGESVDTNTREILTKVERKNSSPL
jgi:hypothetical protein